LDFLGLIERRVAERPQWVESGLSEGQLGVEGGHFGR
jgi:hypothetical protein